MRFLSILIFFPILLLALASPAEAKKPKKISFKKAIASENSLKNEPRIPVEAPKHLYIQPVNKEQACKIVTTQDQLDRKNFRVYWDGECKDGYAFGLGRDIAISDSHHFEELTIYAERGDNSNAPSVGYDFVNNSVTYAVNGSQYPASKAITEIIKDDFEGFFIVYSATKTDENGQSEGTIYSPLRTQKFLTLADNRIFYQITDDTASPSTDPNSIKIQYQIKDQKTGSEVGVGIAGFGNGVVRHYQVVDEGIKDIVLPEKYLEHAGNIEKSIISATDDVIQSVETARELERQYLYKKCNETNKIQGLDDTKVNKICNWRDKFKEPFQAALKAHASELEQMKSAAISLAQQQQVQAQLSAQQQLIQQQISQQSVQKNLDDLRRSNESLRNNNTQIFNSIMGQSVPQVAPLNHPNDNTISCISVGRVTNCR